MTRMTISQAIQTYPLTSSQREIWFDQMLNADLPLYNIGGYVKIPGRLDTALFEQAVNLLVQKHDALRTVLLDTTDEDGVPLQAFVEHLQVSVPVQDVSAEADPHAAALAWMQARFEQPFALTGQPLFRYDLVKLAEDSYYWLLQYHHLISDGWGLALLNRSLAGIYTSLVSGEFPDLDSPSYVELIHSDHAYVESGIFQKDHEYWLKQFPATPEPLLQPRHHGHFAHQDTVGSGCEALYLPRTFYQQLGEMAKRHNASLFHVLLGALYVYFTRTAQREDFTIGLPVLNRANARAKQTAGLFAGVSPCWFNFGTELSFAELLQQIGKTLKAHYRHQRLPVSEINRELSLGQWQLFTITLSYENHEYAAQFGNVESHTTLLLHSWEQTPLTIFVRDFHAEADVKFDFVYNRAYFNTEEIHALQARFVTLLEAVLEQDQVALHQLPIMTSAERQQLQAWNQTEIAYPQGQTIVSLFEAQAERSPDAVAVVFEDSTLTYVGLNARANQLAHHLHQHPVFTAHRSSTSPSNPLIALCVERSLEMVVGLLGILKAGGAYVPLDPAYPDERLRYMLSDCGAKLLLTQSVLRDKLAQIMAEEEGNVSGCELLCLDTTDFSQCPARNLPLQAQPADLAYVIYTSGSTGKPKGVELQQNALVNLLFWQQQSLRLVTPARTLQFTSLSFDVSFQEIFSTLSQGGQLVLVDDETRRDVNVLLMYLLHYKVERLFVPMVMLQQLADQCDAERHADLALLDIITAGEQLRITPALRRLFTILPECRLHNHYGPSESHVVTALNLQKEVSAWPELPAI